LVSQQLLTHSSKGLHLKCQLFLAREGRGNAHLQGDYRKIGDVILKNLNQSTMEHYARYTKHVQLSYKC